MALGNMRELEVEGSPKDFKPRKAEGFRGPYPMSAAAPWRLDQTASCRRAASIIIPPTAASRITSILDDMGRCLEDNNK